MNWLVKLAGYSFSSTQVNLPENIAKKIISWGKKHIKESDVFKEEENTSREDTPHITIKYGLWTNDVRKVKNVISDFGSFEVTLGEINRFTKNDKFDVLKIQVEGKKLHELNKLLSEKLDNTDKYPTYQPHSTICYIKKGTCLDLVGNKEFAGTKIKVSEILFSAKNGKKEMIGLS